MSEVNPIKENYSLDYTMIFIAIVFVIIGVYLFVTNSYMGGETTQRVVIAHVESILEKPTRKINGTLSWFPTSRGDVLYQNDHVLTLATDQLKIKFIDETIVTVSPNSLVKVSVDNDFIDLNLKYGEMKIKQAPPKKRGNIKGNRRIRLNKKIIKSISKSPIAIFKKKNVKKVKVVDVKARENLEALLENKKKLVLENLEKDFRELTSVSQSSVIFSAHKEEHLFQWKGIMSEKVDGLFFELANNSKFQNSKSVRLKMSDTKLTHVLNTGVFFWRIKGRYDKHIFYSNAFKLKANLKDLKNPEILNRVYLKYKKINGVGCYRFRLPAYKNAKNYIVKIYKTKKMKNLVWDKSLSSRDVCWDKRSFGKYYYRYKVRLVNGRISNYSHRGELIFPVSPLLDL